MNRSLSRPLHSGLCMLLLILSCTSLKAQKVITFNFNEDGRMTSQPLSRFKFLGCIKNCRDKYKLRARVLLPLDYFEDEKNRIETMVKEIVTAANDTSSILHKVLDCGKNKELDTLKGIVGKNYDMLKWNFSKNGYNASDVVPEKLRDYVTFIRLLDSLKLQAGIDSNVTRLLHQLNTNYREFSPYRFKVKGFRIEDSCMRFTSVDASDNYCKCISPRKKYIAVEFGIPRQLLTEDLGPESFQLVQHFVMKDFAIKRYNDMLSAHKADFEKLKALQDNIKKSTVDVADLLAAMEDSISIKETCAGEDLDLKMAEARKKIAALRESLEKKMGKFDCSTRCNSQNLLFCNSLLPKWILKLVWLNGDLIRLNPFRFTNQKIVLQPKKPLPTPQQLAELELALKDDSTLVAFWNTQIGHFQDSALRDKKIGIDSAKAGVRKLIAFRHEVQADLAKKTAEKKEADDGKTKNNDETKKNAEGMAAFLTVSKVKYNGWMIAYKHADRDNMWLRNYDFNNGLKSKDKFKFKYPENENVSLLVHNLTPGMTAKVTESIAPGTDSSEWSIFANAAIKELSQLYATVQPVAGTVRTALSIINAKPVKVEASAIGFQPLIETLNSPADSSKIDKLAQSKELIPGATIRVTTADKTNVIALSTNPNNFAREIKQAVASVTDLLKTTPFLNNDACYIKYLKSLIALRSAPDLIDESLKTREDSIPSYFTYHHQLTDSIPTYVNNYQLKIGVPVKADSVTEYKAASFIKVAPYHYFSLSAGIAYTPNAGSITSIDTTGGGFKINRDEDRARLIVGVRYYPFGLYNLKNPEGLFRDFRWKHRLSVQVATGIPKPLQNLYAGGGFDIFPGLTLSAGAHFQQRNQYEIFNNQIVNRSIRYKAEAFYAITMDPMLFVSAITSIFQ